MNQQEINITEFTKVAAQKLKQSKVQQRGFEMLDGFPLFKGKQCIYVLNWKQSRVTYIKDVQILLGYKNDKFNMQTALNNVHPEDALVVNRVIRAIVSRGIGVNVSLNGQYLNLTFRIQKKDGTYIKVLQQSSVYEKDDIGRMISNVSLLTDISFISNNNKVEWDIYFKDIDRNDFKKTIFKDFVKIFTKRELEIIHLIEKGLTNTQIAEKLFISIYTVKVHRKHILKKSNSHNSRQLLQFCQKHSVL